MNTALRENTTRLTYLFDGHEQSSNTFHANKSSVTKPISVEVHGSDGSRIVLENIDFAWNAPPIIQPSNYKSGQKGAIIEMFGWPYADIEQECEALGKMGYLGVKVYPQR